MQTTSTSGNASTVDYTYDVLNRLATTINGTDTTTYSYDAVGNRSRIAYANGTAQVYTYDSLNRLTRLESRDTTDAAIQRFDYTLHPTGRRTQIDELSGRSTAYTYDSLYRLTQESITDTTNGNYSAQYRYDAVGNRIESIIDGVTTQYSYDNNDRLTQQGGSTYSHDAQGNTLTETLDGTTTTYRYNSQQEMVSTTKDGVESNYSYNIDGIRTSANTTSYLVDSNRDYAQVLVETSAGNNVVYTYGDDLISQNRDTGTFFYHYDGLGSVRGLSDSAGALTDSYDYAAFGEVLNETGATVNNYKYTGEQFDQGLNQYYLRARYYNQASGRFTQMDTYAGRTGEPVTLHKYLYAHSDPVNFTDPTGNFSLGSFGVASSIQATLTTASIASSAFDLFSFSGSGEPLDLKQSAKNVGLSILLSYGGAKIGKFLFKKAKAKQKKFLKKRTLYRGVNVNSRFYSDAKRGFVPGGFEGLFMSGSDRNSAAEKHNQGLNFGTPFSSWTARRIIARDFATRSTTSKGVIIKAKVMSFRIFKSPDRKSHFSVSGLRQFSREYEFLVVGPVQGIPTKVGR